MMGKLGADAVLLCSFSRVSFLRISGVYYLGLGAKVDAMQ